MQKLKLKIIFILAIFFAVLLLPKISWAADFYVTQNATGADSGLDCANAHAAAWFNTNAAGGNTYHLCGTFTGTANSTMLTIPVSGTAGNILYVLFETDAVLEAPYWSQNGAILSSGKNYVTIDGGTNGIIRNTDNGTSKTYHTYSAGITASGSYLTIKNLTVNNIYQNEGNSLSATDIQGALTCGISVYSNGSGNIIIDNNYIHQARIGINLGFSGSGGTNIEISNNTTNDHCWQMCISTADSNVTISNFNIHGNDMSNWTDWWYPAANYHQDGIILFGNATVTNVPINIYSNYIHGLKGSSVTGSIYPGYGGSPPGFAVAIYNNIISPDPIDGGVGLLWLGNGKTNYIYNNTIIGAADSLSGGIMLENANTVINMVNNIVAHTGTAIDYNSAGPVLGTIDYNLWYDVCNKGDPKRCWSNGAQYFYNIGTWQAAGHDTHGYMADPKFVSSTDFYLQPTSPAINVGNSSISPLIFNTDYAGVIRPQGSGWDIGAYEYVGAGDTIPPAAPTGVAVN